MHSLVFAKRSINGVAPRFSHYHLLFSLQIVTVVTPSKIEFIFCQRFSFFFKARGFSKLVTSVPLSLSLSPSLPLSFAHTRLTLGDFIEEQTEKMERSKSAEMSIGSLLTTKKRFLHFFSATSRDRCQFARRQSEKKIVHSLL